jgi:hypothetical protein
MSAANAYARDHATSSNFAVTQADNCRSLIGNGTTLTTTTSSQQSSAAPAGTRAAHIHARGACWVKSGSANPAAAVDDGLPLPADTVFYMPCRPGWKVAVIADTGATGARVSIAFTD